MLKGISVYLSEEEYRKLSSCMFCEIKDLKEFLNSEYVSETQKKHYQDELDLVGRLGFKLHNTWCAAHNFKKDTDEKSYLDSVYAILNKEAP